MKLSDGVQQAYERKWSMINTFTVQIILNPAVVNILGNFTSDINLNVVSVNTPDFTNTPIESYVGNKWLIHNGADQLYRYSITFKDQDQMYLYTKFLQIYKMTKDNYFDDVASKIYIIKDGDWYSEIDKTIFELDGTLIEGISNLAFNNETENQIAEFTINFKCNNPIIG